MHELIDSEGLIPPDDSADALGRHQLPFFVHRGTETVRGTVKGGRVLSLNRQKWILKCFKGASFSETPPKREHVIVQKRISD